MKETIEEAAERYFEEQSKSFENDGGEPFIDISRYLVLGFIEGAKYQAERTYSSLSELRNELYDKLPTGDVDAFELLMVIKNHLQKLDELYGEELKLKK
jgi:hypothetical protein